MNGFKIPQVDIVMRPGDEVLPSAPGGDLQRRLLATLHFQLATLLHRVYQDTATLPGVGDELTLEPNVLVSWYQTQEGPLPRWWRVDKRCFLTPGNQLTVAYQLRQIPTACVDKELVGEPLPVNEIIDQIPSPTGRRSLTRWLNNPSRPIRTWQQLARHADELPSERGFNVKHLTLIQQMLVGRGFD